MKTSSGSSSKKSAKSRSKRRKNPKPIYPEGFHRRLWNIQADASAKDVVFVRFEPGVYVAVNRHVEPAVAAGAFLRFLGGRVRVAVVLDRDMDGVAEMLQRAGRTVVMDGKVREFPDPSFAEALRIFRRSKKDMAESLCGLARIALRRWNAGHFQTSRLRITEAQTSVRS